ncbi:helix-turn-helix domain-containing protein [Clostridium sp. BJN0013]|uniref:helix-turn-helix domain-containing protein n=1 Tax=Clostridium sp. BJN0013 TaxID=3236840 RepID=UPI0034C5E1FE
MNIAHNLKELRTRKGLTQDELSKLLNINRATYAHYETGRREPDLETLKMLAKFFNVTLDQLAGSIIDPECGSSAFLHKALSELYPDKLTKMSYNELLEEIKKDPERLKLIQLMLNNKNTHSNIEQVSEPAKMDVKISTALKKLRYAKNVKQEDVAKAIGISKSGYGYYEQGRSMPDPEMLLKLAKYFTVSVDYLLGNTDKKEPEIESNIPKKYSDKDKKILDDISSLDDDLKKEAEKYIELLKLKQSMDAGKDESSAILDQDIC